MTRPFSTHLDQRDRADAIKRRASVVANAERHGVKVTRDGDGGWRSACPHCERGHIRIASTGETYRCGACGASGDVITHERAVTGAKFSAACEALERAFPGAPRQEGAGDLFSRESCQSSGASAPSSGPSGPARGRACGGSAAGRSTRQERKLL